MATAAKKHISRKISPEAREVLLRQSLTAPSLTQLAHEAGVTSGLLYSWRQDARDGKISVPADLREALTRQMPRRTYAPRKYTAKKKFLTAAQAKDVVISSIRRRKTTTLDKIADRHGISTQTLQNWRSRARDGLIKVPNADLAILRTQMKPHKRAIPDADPVEASNIATAPAKPASKQKAQKPKKAAAKTKASKSAKQPQAAVQSAAPKVKAASVDVVIVRQGDRAVEIPASLDPARMAAIVSAAMAA